MSADKYPSIFSRQMKPIVYVFIYIKFYISMSRLDYIYQDLHTGNTRFQ